MNKTKKLLSVFLAVLMIMSCVPVVAFAATSLTNSNVEIVVPTVTPSEINYGQSLAELTVSGGEMWYNGTQIQGYFTVHNEAVVPAASNAYEVMFKFVPTDSEYTCRSTFRKANTAFTGTWPTIKIKAEAVASLAEAPVASSFAVGGKKIHTSVLSGGKVVDGEGNDITALGKWQWADTTIVVNESGTYTAVWKATNNDYDPISVDVYIAVETVQTKTYFTDENGNETVPKIRWSAYSALNDGALVSYIERLAANCGEFSVSQVKTSNVDITALGEYECTARITPKSEYYTTEDLTFKLIVEPKVIEVNQVLYLASGKFIGVYTETKRDPKGTYDVYVDGVLVGTGLEYGTYRVECPWEPEVSGTYNVKVVYNPIENDKYTMEDYTTDLEVNVARVLTREGLSSNIRVNGKQYYSTSIVNGDEIFLECMLTDVFVGWEITDTQGNAIDLGVDLTANKITFTMPDQDIIVTAKATIDEEEPGNDNTGDDTDTDDGSNSGNIGSTSIFGRFIEFLRNLFEKYINIFKTVFGMFVPAN